MTTLQPVLTQLSQLVERNMRDSGAPGASVAFTDRDRLLGVHCWGYANLDARTPWTPDTMSEIGSITKSFTAIAVMRLVEMGLLDLHAPVARALAWFDVKSEYAPITVHHLLSHTAGIIRGTDFTGESRAEVYALRETCTFAPPGQTFYYSNVGYKALGVIVENLYNRPYGNVVQNLVLDPLGMQATHPVTTHATRKKLAVGYRPFYDDRLTSPAHPMMPATWAEMDTADGCIASTPADMAAYVRMLLARGVEPKGRIMTEESFTRMTSRFIGRPEFGTAYYGYGLVTNDVNGHTVISHGGGMIGYLSHIMADMDAGLGVVVMTNGRMLTAEITEYALALLRAWREDTPLPAVPAPPHPDVTGDATNYAGSYRCDHGGFDIVAEGSQLAMVCDQVRATLYPQRAVPDTFRVDHPDWDLHPLRFGRDNGLVVEAHYGPDWYRNDRYTGPRAFKYPAEWESYVGHYRSYKPWMSNFRILLRKGQLFVCVPGEDVPDIPLVPMGIGVFSLGPKNATPERIRFDVILDGKARRATYSGAEYWRTFTP